MRLPPLPPGVYKIPNAFIGLILQGEPKKLASVVKPKTRRAPGVIAVDFVGGHLKEKKATEFNKLDKLLSDEDLGILILFPTIPMQVIPPEFVRSAREKRGMRLS